MGGVTSQVSLATFPTGITRTHGGGTIYAPFIAIQFFSDGHWDVYKSVATGPTGASSLSNTGDWVTPASAGIGSSYWLRYTSPDGAPYMSNGTLNTWQNITATTYMSGNTYIVFYDNTSDPLPIVTVINLTIDIATNSSGTNIVETINVVLSLAWSNVQ